MSPTGRLHQLFSQEGQSPWLDNLKRSLITSGELIKIRDSGIRGLTSNPTIFQKAIQGSSDYDEQFDELVRADTTNIEIYWTMVTSDIRGALDVFAPIYASSHGKDGFVSVEVDPNLAHDGPGTLQAGKELWERVGRQNLMVKIPATLEGLNAIRAMIAHGYNVNVTLIFGLERYKLVMEAYIAGLEDRLSQGHSIVGISSVASFFISRVDSEIDRRLEDLQSPRAQALRGRAAVTQAKLAYEEFSNVFSGPRWNVLAKAGANVQRPLWASTSTKNPAYPDTLYVDQLIGANTVNTLPDATVEAFVDHGTVLRTIDQGLQQCHEIWQQLSDVGIDLDAVAHQLELEGVASFQKSFTELLDALAMKTDEIRSKKF